MICHKLLTRADIACCRGRGLRQSHVHVEAVATTVRTPLGEDAQQTDSVVVTPIGADLLVSSSGEKERERGKRFPLGRGEIEVGRKPHGAERERGGAAGTAEGTRARVKEGRKAGE